MYSETVKPKVDEMFRTLRKKAAEAVSESSGSKEAINRVTKIVSSELTARSKSILSDMLFDLTDDLMETDFFSDIARQNRFTEKNLRQEVLSKYQFAPNSSVDYNEASRQIQALKVGGIALAAGGAIEVGVVLAAGLSLSSLVPIPICALIAVSIGAALTDYYVVEPIRDKRTLSQALDNYLIRTQKQFLKWFDEVEIYFNRRVDEIKQTI